MRIRSRLAVAGSIPALALGVALATAAPGSAAATNVSFSSTAGNSAHWTAHHTGIVFVMNNASAPKGQGDFAYAVALLHNTPHALPATAPTITETGYAAGTPRLDLVMSDGSVIFGYPDGTWESNSNPGVYVSWDSILSTYGSLLVARVYVVADTSQPVPYTATVTSLVYAGSTYVP